MLVLLGMALVADRADAQWNGFFNVNGGVQTADRIVTHTLEENVYDETAKYDATMTSPGGNTLDAWAGVRVRGNVGIGLGATILNARGAIGVEGLVPSPLFTSSDRTAAPIERPGLNHQQVGLHLPLLYMAPVSERVLLVVSAGPSWFRLRHDALATVDRSTERAPYEMVELTDFTTTVEEGTGIGYHAGLDVTYLVVRWVGVGLYVRYSGGTVEIATPGGEQSIDVGGAQAGAGLRFRF